MVALSGASGSSWWSQRFELSRGGAASSLLPMEGLRGLAVFLVFLVHYSTLVAPWLSTPGPLVVALGAVHTIGNAGVDLFFVLSGYLIYGHLISARQPFGRYFSRRVQRIYPTFLAVLAIYLVLSWLRPGDSKLPAGTAAATLYLVQNLLLLPGMLPIEPMITVAWSLSYEMFYYLLMPGLIAFGGLHRRSAAWRVRFFIGLTLLALAGFALLGGPVRLVMFLAGVLLFDVLPRARAPGSAIGWAMLLLSLLAMLLPLSGAVGQALQTGLLCIGFFGLCFACFAQPRQSIGLAFCWWPLRWLGNMSYSYYLVHGLSLKALFLVVAKLWPPGTAPWLGGWLVVPAFAFTLLPSALLFLLVERPFSLRAKPAPVLLAVPAASAGRLTP